MTPEQLATQEQLQAAIETHVQAFRRGDSDDRIEIATDWIVIAAVTSVDPETEDRNYAYNLAFSTGEMPEHVAYGLLDMAEKLIEKGEKQE